MAASDPDQLCNLRGLLPLDDSKPTYADYCREERNFAAILYAQLLRPEGLQHFLGRLKGIGPIEQPERAEVFFEYAHARDLWHRFGKQFGGKDPAAKRRRDEGYRQAILALIEAPPGLRNALTGRSIAKFNKFFLGRRRASEREIQMPNQWDERLMGKWARIARKCRWYTDTDTDEAREFAKRICRLKWAFNAKADLVIHLPDNKAVCVEIKVASGESVYRAGPGKNSFKLTQTKLQRYVLEELLGYETRFVLLTPSEVKPRRHKCDLKEPQRLTWSEVLKGLPDHDDELPFVERMLRLDVLGVSDKAEEVKP
jgi:hypothetical protein